jgi:hypothetical protein
VRLIEQIGSYAGLAAIPGLAVLAALYFSQARDVRRLRDWAGRAPERAAEQAVGGRAPVQAQQAAQPGVVQPAGAANPAAAPGEKQATEAPGVAKPAALTPAAVASAAAGATKTPPTAGAVAASAGAGGGSATGTVTRPGPPAVGAGGRPPAAAAVPPRRQIPRTPSAQTSVLGTAARPRDPWYRRVGDRLPAGRYIALIVVGALVLGGGAAFGITQLGGSDSGGDQSSAAQKSRAAPAKEKSPAKKENVKATPAVDPSKVTVTVVNGTTIPNLARDTADKLSSAGFQIGNKVTGTGSLAAAESVVEYKPGAEAEARYVASKLHISQKQPADPDAVAQAGPAQVIVVLGADQAPGG